MGCQSHFAFLKIFSLILDISLAKAFQIVALTVNYATNATSCLWVDLILFNNFNEFIYKERYILTFYFFFKQ